MTIRTLNWNNFKWGLSDNPYLWAEWTYQNWSANIDTQTEPDWVKLASAIVTSFTPASKPKVVKWQYTWCTAWEIYDWSTLRATLTTTSVKDIWWMEIMQGYLWIFCAQKIHKLSLSTWTLTEDVNTTAHAYWDYKHTINYWDDIYFTSENTFNRLTVDWVVTELFTASNVANFNWLTVFQDQFRLYWTDQAWNWINYLVPISQSATSFDYAQVWDNMWVLWAVNVWSNDYVITWHWNPADTDWWLDSDLWICSWTLKNAIKVNLDNNTHWRVFSWQWVSRLDEVYLVWAYNLADSNTKTIFKIGSFFPWLPTWLTPIATMPSWYEITSIWADKDWVYIAAYSWTTYKIFKFDPKTPPTWNWYADTWQVISLVQDLWNPYNQKTLEQIDIAYDCLASWSDTTKEFSHWWTITLYVRFLPTNSWTQVCSITPTTIWSTRITQNQLRALWIGNFWQLEYKVVLTPATESWANKRTPKLKWILTTYDDGIKV